jgi:hypothetical protein
MSEQEFMRRYQARRRVVLSRGLRRAGFHPKTIEGRVYLPLHELWHVLHRFQKEVKEFF